MDISLSLQTLSLVQRKMPSNAVKAKCKFCRVEFPSKTQCRKHEISCPRKQSIEQESEARRRAVKEMEDWRKKAQTLSESKNVTKKKCEFCGQEFPTGGRLLLFDHHRVSCRLAQPVKPFRGTVSLLSEDSSRAKVVQTFDLSRAKVVQIEEYDLNDPGLAQYR